MSYWQDKVVVVTGGSAGLGRALAAAFAERKAKVVVAARGQEALDKAVVELRSRGGELLAVPADVTRQSDVDSLIAQTIDRFGRLDVLINCAGRSTRGAVLDTTPEEFQALWELDFLAAVRCARAAAPHLLTARGHLVNIGSLACKSAGRFLGAYPPAKHALAAWSQQLRLEAGPRGLHVLLVCPGPIQRDDAGARYAAEAAALPDAARRPGGGVKLTGIDPRLLSAKLLRACEKRQPELVVPGRARLLFAISQLSPTVGDWLLSKLTGGD